MQSFLLVALSEMGDKTQLLALILAARYRRPWTILMGVFLATVINHGVAAYCGVFVTSFIQPEHLRWILFGLFLAFAIWILIPDRESEVVAPNKWGVFTTTVVLFFLAEMGDKTQLATVVLAARFQNVWSVTAGTTFGMMVANSLGIFCGDQLLRRIPMKWIRIVSSLLFVLFAIAVLNL